MLVRDRQRRQAIHKLHGFYAHRDHLADQAHDGLGIISIILLFHYWGRCGAKIAAWRSVEITKFSMLAIRSINC